MGAVTIAMSAARDIEHTVRLNLLALMTAAYGIGQIIGPLIANEIYSNNESFTGALITASMALLVASILSLFYRSLPRCKT
jgi:MFS family permease